MKGKLVTRTMLLVLISTGLGYGQVKSKLSIHTSLGQQSWDFIENAKPRVVKIFESLGSETRIKGASQSIQIVARKYLTSQPIDGDPVVRAQEWFNGQKANINANPLVDYWEAYNEIGNLIEVTQPGVPTMQWYAAFEAERIRLLAEIGEKACIGNFATGNIRTPDEDGGATWSLFAPAFDAAKANGGVMGLHEYGCPMDCGWDYKTDAGWLVGRYRKLYRGYLIPNNKVIPLVITEAGVDNLAAISGCCGHWGWKNGFSWIAYKEQLIWFDNIMKADSYVIGATIFALDISADWASFDIGDTNLMAWLTPYVGQYPLEGFGTLSGTVRDAQTSYVVANATVTVLQSGQVKYVTNSAINGTFTIVGVTVGSYDVTVTTVGYATSTRNNVTVSEGQTTTVDFSLTSSPAGILQGTVKNAYTTRPIAAATVEIKKSGQTWYTLTTDSNGTFKMRLDVGTYDVSGQRGGYVSDTVTGINVSANQTVNTIVSLTPQVVPNDGVNIESVSTAVTQITPGDTGKTVTMAVSNATAEDLIIDNVGLSFIKDGSYLAQYFTITPKTTNPTVLTRNTANNQFEFTVDVAANAPAGLVTIDGSIRGWRNIVPNGSFEENSTVPPTHWVNWNSGTNGTYTIDTTTYTHGKQSYKFSIANNVNDEWVTSATSSGQAQDTQLLPISPSVTYDYTVWHKDNVATDDINRIIVWEQYDAGRNKIGTDGRYYLKRKTIWSYGSTSFTTASNTAYIRAWISMQPFKPSISGSIWYDDVRIIKANYVVGDNAAVTTDSWTVGQGTGDTTAPAVPTLTAPANASSQTTGTPTFTWSAVTDTQSPPVLYEFQIDNDVTFATPESVSQQNVTTNQLTPSSALSNGTYYWRVRARDSASSPNTSGWTSSWSVVINATSTGDTTAPAVPTLSSPSNAGTQTTGTPTFDWTDVTDPSTPVLYDIQIDNNSGVTSPELIITNLSVSQYTSTVTLTNGTYYWRVHARDSAATPNYSAWTNPWSVIVNVPPVGDTTAPAIPTLSLPVNASTNTTGKPSFDWTDVTDPSTPVLYDLEVDNNSAFSSPEIQQTNLTSSQYPSAITLSNGTYYWRVRARDSASPPNYSNWTTTPWSVIVAIPDNTPPSVPTLSNPSSGSTQITGTPLFDWTDVTDQSMPVVYDIQVDNDSSFNLPEISQTNLSVSQHISTTTLSNGTYYWRVRARDNASPANDSAWTNPWTITISISQVNDNIAPPVPTLSLPLNAGTDTTGKPTFTWTVVTDVNDQSPPVLYELYVDNNSSLTTPEIIQLGYEVQYQPTTALPNGTYYWQVRAQDSAPAVNKSAWTAPWSVTVAIPDTTAPGVPSLSSPSDASTQTTGTPTFSWSNVTDSQTPPVRYEIQVDNNVTFDSAEISQTNINTTQFTPSSALTNGTYYWRIRARDSVTPTANLSNWSSVWSVVINATLPGDTTAPAIPTLIYPTNNLTTNNQSLTFDWSDVTDPSVPVLYDIQVDNDVAFGSAEISQTNVTPSQYTPTNALANGTYYWRVRARDSAVVSPNYSIWSEVWTVVVNGTGKVQAKPDEKFVTSTIPAKFGTEAEVVQIYDSTGGLVIDLNKTEFDGGSIQWKGTDEKGKRIESGAYIYKIKTKEGKFTYGMVILAK